MVLYWFFLGFLTFKVYVRSVLKAGTRLVVGEGVSYIKHCQLYIYIIGLIAYDESMLYLKTAQLWFKSRHFLGHCFVKFNYWEKVCKLKQFCKSTTSMP
jgi:hypothetical protein